MNSDNQKLGVIIARFQVAELTQGHKDLIEFVIAQSDQVLIMLGISKSFPTDRNPLSFGIRKQMILKEFPDVEVQPIDDHPSDEVWSSNLDKIIFRLFPTYDITLFGSRDSFLDYYSGKYETTKFEPKHICSGTDQRCHINNRTKHSKAFRNGLVYSQLNRRGTTYSTVDLAVVKEKEFVLLAQKEIDLGKFRFPGGFVDPEDASLENAVKREAKEEISYVTSVELDAFKMIGSSRIDDFRYRGTKDGIMTTFFVATHIFGMPRAGDDVKNVKWIPISELMDVLVDEHKVLGEMLIKYLSRNEGNG